MIMNLKNERLLALLMDLFLLGIIQMISENFLITTKTAIGEFSFIGFTFSYGLSISVVFCLIYFFLFDVFTEGRTLGKTILKIKVVNQNNSELSRKRRFIRSSLKVLSLIFWPITGVLFLLNSWTLQDKVCNTKTVNFLHSFSEEGN